MFLSWLRQRRRKKILATPFPTRWLAYLEKNVPHYRCLDAQEQARLRDDLRFFVAEKNWEGCGGLVVTDEMKVTIAAQASLMALGLEGDTFRNVLSVLIYPSGYAVPEERWYEGWSITGESDRLGEAWYRGPVILSWAEVRRDSRRPGAGRNLVWHEFAHQIDMLDRSTNGTPPLSDRNERKRWHDVMTAEYERLITDAEQGRATLLDTYGANSEAEFFAVATECFFDCPIELRAQHPHLYDLLRGYYRQDPAARLASGA
jgi:Mlc titration factor MtfA (ptsG expression regulator)